VSTTRKRPNRRRELLGVTDDDYARMLAEQGGHCALCPSMPKTRELHVDHDHATGHVRGLLCFRCNHVLHSWMDSAWALRLAEYLRRAEADGAHG
jgi:Recombination endonuclease VII